MIILNRRNVIVIEGPDRLAFLNGLISNDLKKIVPGQAIYATLLTPQGRFLFDFFILEHNEAYLLDVEAARSGDLLKRLRMYKLRSDIELKETNYKVAVSLKSAAAPDLLHFSDPRLPALGMRAFVLDAAEGDESLDAYEEKRMEYGIPESGIELIPEKSILLENGLDELQAIDWQKGCYMGQELTARTRYRGLVRKRLLPFKIEGVLPQAPSLEDDNITLLSFSPSRKIALGMTRLEALPDLQTQGLRIGGAKLIPYVPDWMHLPEPQQQN